MKALVIVLVLIIIGVGAWYFISQSGQESSETNVSAGSTPTPTPSQTPTPTGSSQAVGKTVKVEMISAGFSPKELTINVGDTVQFINKDAREWWPASGPHPQHTACPGFDAQKRMKAGESYSHTFSKVGECPMHDHSTGTRFTGKIIVK